MTNVSISDPNGVLGLCVPTNLAPGQSLTCTATHTVTAADLAAKVILNQAVATAHPVIDFEVVCPLLGANGLQCPPTAASVSAESNTVVLNRATNLPGTGAAVMSKLVGSGEMFGLGALLMVVGRRRKPRRRR